MPQYYRSGMISDRHPFHDATTEVLPTVQATPKVSTAAVNILGPIVSGSVITFVTYGVARQHQIDKPKAWGIATTIGLITAIGQVASGWLKNWAAKQAELAQGVATATVAPAQTVIPPQGIPTTKV